MFAQLRKAGSEHRTYGLRREAGPARREGSRSRDVSARHCRRCAASRTCCLGGPFVTPKNPAGRDRAGQDLQSPRGPAAASGRVPSPCKWDNQDPLPQAGQRSVCVSMCARACDTKTDGRGDWSLSLKSRTPKAAPSSDLLPCFLGLPRPSRVLGHEGAD